MSQVSSPEGSRVEGLDDGGLNQVYSVLHRELIVHVARRRSGILGIKEGLQAYRFVVELGGNPLSSSPQLFVKPGVGGVGVYLSVSDVYTPDRADGCDVLSLSASLIFAYSSKERVGTGRSWSVP